MLWVYYGVWASLWGEGQSGWWGAGEGGESEGGGGEESVGEDGGVVFEVSFFLRE